ncbi:MAG: biotin-dependent carboxyltransferase family protein [Chloroflexi bacterium]|nr:biotin-dependent carboxyltransferase family protein [Chloroflexota bacterium]
MNRYIRVIQPGPMTLVQDRGRVGFQQLGVSVSGAVDADALAIGNLLVGNDRMAAGLEMMLGGLEIEFSMPTVFAVTGADVGATVDEVPVATHVSYLAHAGAHLKLEMVHRGLRAYVAMAGGIAVSKTLGSRSTHIPSKLGGIEGRMVMEADLLPLGDPGGSAVSGLWFDDGKRAAIPSELNVRIVLGPQDDEFSSSGVETLLGSTYTVTDQSNRQGLRLDGPVIESKSGRYDIISDAVVNGSIQVPGDGKPIILLADRQTTGGYAKIATVVTVDLPELGQASPGTNITFTAISVDEAQQLLVQQDLMISSSALVRLIEPISLHVDTERVSVGVSGNGMALMAYVQGDIYPISIDEYTPAE